jgi:hypothetical protein
MQEDYTVTGVESPDNGYNARITALEVKERRHEEVFKLMLQRLANLEGQRDRQAVKEKMDVRQTYNPLIWREAAVRLEADLLPPARGDVATIVALKAFAERFLAYDDLGQCVPATVRDDAREALGRARVES